MVLHAEPNLQLVECFDPETNTCPIISSCGLKQYLQAALDAFLAELNERTLAELLSKKGRKEELQRLFQIGPAGSSPNEAARRSAYEKPRTTK